MGRKTTETKLHEFQSSNKSNSDISAKIDSKTSNEDFKGLDAFIRDEISKTKKDIEYVLERCDNLQNQISSNNERINLSSSESTDNKIRDLESKFQGTLSKLEEIISSYSSFPSSIETLSEARTVLMERLSTLESSLTSLKREGCDTLGKVENIKRDLESNINEFRITRDENKTLGCISSDTEENLKTDIRKLENSSKDTLKIVTEKTSLIEKTVKTITEEFSKLEAQISNAGWAKKSILQDLDDYCKREIKSLKSNVELTLNRIDEFKSYGENIIKSQMESQNKGKEEETDGRLEKDIQSCSKEISHLSRKYDELLAIKNKLQTDKCDNSEVILFRNDISLKLENLEKNIETLKQETSEHKQGIDSLNEITKKLSSLGVKQTDSSETVSQSLETRVTAGMAQIENKMAIFESSRKEMKTKLTDLTSKQQKLNEEYGGISEIKEKLKSKSEIWDNKLDLKSVEQLLKTEIDTLKKNSTDETLKSDLETLKLNVTQCNSKNSEKLETISSQCKLLENGLKEAQKASEKVLEISRKITNLENQFTNDLKSIKDSSLNETYVTKQDIQYFSNELKTLADNDKSNDLKNHLDILENKYKEVMEEINKLKSMSHDVKSSMINTFKDQITSDISKINDKVANGCVSNNKDRENLESSLKKLEDSMNIEKEKLGNMESKLNCIDIKDILKKEDISKFINSFNYLTVTDCSSFVKKEDLSNVIKKDDVSDFVKKSEVTDFAKKSEVGSDVKQLKTFINEELSKLKKIEDKSSKEDISETIDSFRAKFISQEEFTKMDINYSKLSELVDHLQSELVRQHQDSSSHAEQIEKSLNTMKIKLENSSAKTPETNSSSSGISDMMKSIQAAVGNLETNMQKIKSDVPSRGEIEKLQVAMEESHKGKDGINLSSIEKQRKGWEEAREKAEEMSQIFDSLIITNDRPYVSCGLDNEVTEPGFLEFSQFELINKVSFDTDSNQFTLIEPGVYLLQMGGTIEGGSLIAKLVSDDIAVDFMTIEGSKNHCFKCRSSVFTIDDDDQIAESLMVELVGNNDSQCCVGTDFFFLLYKISEVSNVDPVDQM